MGCCPAAEIQFETGSSQDGLDSSPQEHAICLAEDSLLYHDHRSLNLFTALDSLDEEGKLSPVKFHSFSTEMHLNTQRIDEDQSLMKAFYRRFKDGNRYDTQKLQLLAALLGRGDAGEKAALIFRAAARGKKTIQREAAHTALEVICDIAGEYLPHLAVDGKKFTADQCTSLVASFSQRKDEVRDRLCALILQFQLEVTEEEFVYRFLMSDTLRCATNARNIRRFLRGELTLGNSLEVLVP